MDGPLIPESHVIQILDFASPNYKRGGAFPMGPDGEMESWSNWFNRMILLSLEQTGHKIVKANSDEQR